MIGKRIVLVHVEMYKVQNNEEQDKEEELAHAFFSDPISRTGVNYRVR